MNIYNIWDRADPMAEGRPQALGINKPQRETCKG